MLFLDIKAGVLSMGKESIARFGLFAERLQRTAKCQTFINFGAVTLKKQHPLWEALMKLGAWLRLHLAPDLITSHLSETPTSGADCTCTSSPPWWSFTTCWGCGTVTWSNSQGSPWWISHHTTSWWSFSIWWGCGTVAWCNSWGSLWWTSHCTAPRWSFNIWEREWSCGTCSECTNTGCDTIFPQCIVCLATRYVTIHRLLSFTLCS